jgi:Fe-S-cluster containining protein
MRACTQCGKCCLLHAGDPGNEQSTNTGLGMATDEDLARWRDRPDIMRFIDPGLPDLWVSPRTGEDTERCPWLRKLPRQHKYKCRIYDVRPNACRGYPVDIEQMVRDGCELLEEGDLEKPRAVLVAELLKLSVYFHRQIVWLQDRFPEGRFEAVPSLCKAVTRAEIEAADWSLTPGRYVRVAPPEKDEDFKFEQTLRDIHVELADLNREAAELAARIQENFAELGA